MFIAGLFPRRQALPQADPRTDPRRRDQMEHPDSCYINVGFLGGAMEVGASCILVQIGDYNILLDAGIRQAGGKDPLPDLRKIQECGELDAIIISHAHMDHIGSLPVISR